MKIMNNKLIAYGIVLTLILSTAIISVSSEGNDLKNNELVKIIILDTREGKISERYISYGNYEEIFEENNFPYELSFSDYIEGKINTLLRSNILSFDKSNELRNDLKLLTRKDNNIRNILPLNYDVLNIFNGIFFKLKGEKISSIFDMNVFNFPILNTNITALFSGYSEFQGYGFIFSIGFLGVQNIFKYSLIGQPHFPEINGAMIGFVGILIISEGIETDNLDSDIIGIGMNVLTYWNQVE
ncbi:MAG: hypothetical protein LN408_00250 [Candidatus Thermoplasmatota archaeon]|nr:hypothetical protein [Candidatus Thermoplasmatota archaeon]MCK5300390.1 hypothetical protein [Thermoplasmatales archaeon]